jgi:alkylated DNA repair dioxygenase AlkB
LIVENIHQESMVKNVKPLTLFDEPSAMPEGFAYYPAFIDAMQEAELLAVVSRIDLHPMHFQGYTAKRKVASFGYDYDFSTRKLLKGKPVPESLLWLIDKVAVQMNTASDDIAEVLITEYPPGSVINWHRDAPPFDRIAGLSLGSEVMFKMRPHEKGGRSKRSTVSHLLEPRSLYIIEGAVRSGWEHSTAPVTETRYSITFRTLRSL